MTNRYTRLTDKETTFGTDPATGLQSYRVLENTHVYDPTDEEVRTTETDLLIERKERTLDISRGQISMHCVLDKKFARWFAMALGKETYSTVNVAVGRHVFEPKRVITDTDTYPSFAMRKGIDIQERPYTGFGVDRLTISFKKGEPLKITVNTFGRKPGADTSLQTLSDYSTQVYLTAAHINTMTLGGSSVKFEDWSITVDGPAEPAHAANSLDISRIDIKPVNVRFESTIRFLNETQLENFLAKTAQAIVIKFDNGVAIPGSSPSTNYSLKFDLFRLNLEDADVRTTGQDRLMQKIAGNCETDSNGDLFKITLEDETVSAYV